MLWAVMSYPFRAAWWCWETYRWARKKWKLWRRKAPFGDAKLAEWAAFKGNTGFPLGKKGTKLVRAHHESCVLMFGARGAGKSLTLGGVLYHSSGENLIVQDPPKALYGRFIGDLQAKGYAVYKVDLDEPDSGLGYNPADYLVNSSDMTWDRDLKELAGLIMADTDTGGKNGAHFRDMGIVFIKGVLGWLFVHDREKASPYGVAELLLIKGDAARRETFKAMMKSADDSTRMAINAWEGVGLNEGGSFKSTLTNALEPWVWKGYRKLTDGATRLQWDAVFLDEKPAAVFICGGMMGGDTSKHFVRMFFGQAAGTLSRQFIRYGRNPRDTAILIDEGSVVGKCEPLIQVVAELRKAGVKLWLAYQNFSQLYQAYGQKDGDLLFANSDLIVCGGLKTPKDYETVSKLLGSHTVNPMSKGKEVSFGESPRFVLSPEQMFSLDSDKLVGVIGNKVTVMDKNYTIRGGRVYY